MSRKYNNPYERSGRSMNVKLDFCNYAIKADLE